MHLRFKTSYVPYLDSIKDILLVQNQQWKHQNNVHETCSIKTPERRN